MRGVNGINVPEMQLSAFPLLAHGHSHRLFVGALFSKLRPRPRIGFPGMELPDVLADRLFGLAFFKRHISLLEIRIWRTDWAEKEPALAVANVARHIVLWIPTTATILSAVVPGETLKAIAAAGPHQLHSVVFADLGFLGWPTAYRAFDWNRHSARLQSALPVQHHLPNLPYLGMLLRAANNVFHKPRPHPRCLIHKTVIQRRMPVLLRNNPGGDP